jgi:hypothetical protein
MKRISLLLVSLVMLCSWIGAQNEKISFNETEHDFGTIGEKDGNVTFDFVLTNNGTEPVVITNAQASCGCTRPVWTKEPIEPGKQGTISVTYSPAGRIGTFIKPVTISFSQGSPISVRIKGTVVQGSVANKSPEYEYPVELGAYRLKSRDLQFGRVGLNQAKVIRLEAYNNSDRPITQKALKLPKYLSVNFNPVIIPAKKSAVIDVTIDPKESNMYGNLSGSFTLLIDDVNRAFPYSATILDDFSQWTATKKADAGKVNLSPSEINFGNFSSGNSRTLKISNSGKSPLNIRTIQLSNPSITVSKTHFVINPGEIAEVKVTADSKKIQSTFTSTLSIVADDPNTPLTVVSVIANTK